MRTRRNVLILLAAAVASAACGGSSGGSVSSGSTDSSPSTSSGTSSGTVTMAMNLTSFTPATLTGAPGSKQTIHFTNATAKPHTFTIADQSIDTAVQPGATGDATVTFPASGELVFVCKYHEKYGMTGKLIAG